jgi:hypothetical protein
MKWLAVLSQAVQRLAEFDKRSGVIKTTILYAKNTAFLMLSEYTIEISDLFHFLVSRRVFLFKTPVIKPLTCCRKMCKI